jgi:predicted ATPase
MITRFGVRNFRCLRHVDVPLGPLNFLVGPNNTGKSSFLKAAEILGHCMLYQTVEAAFSALHTRFDRLLTQGADGEPLEFDCEATWQDGAESTFRAHYEAAFQCSVPNGPDQPVEARIDSEVIELDSGTGERIARFQRTGASQPQRKEVGLANAESPLHLAHPQSTIPYSLWQQDDSRLEGLRRALTSSPKYSFIPQRLAEPCQVQEKAEIEADGFGLAAVLDTMMQVEPERFARIEEALRQFVPAVERVRFPGAGPGEKTILFHEKGGARVLADAASDGLLLFLAHLTVAYAHGEVGILLIEEPETGVHPNRLKRIVQLLRAVSRGELGLPPVQVIATSHSPYLLDWCSKDEVVYFDRDKDGEVRTKRLSEVPEIEDRIEDFESLGAWLYSVGGETCGSHS